jgi:murein DD-endopeptidase MepM/ murein hydrolase activator NlpD
MTEKEPKRSRIRHKLFNKYRLVVLNEGTFEERFSFKLSRLNVFVFSSVLAIFLVGITTLIIAFTPLREYIPGYSSTALKRKATVLAYKADSLQQIVEINERYIESIRKVLTGDLTAVDFNKDSVLEAARQEELQLSMQPSSADSLLRARVALEDKYNPLLEEEVEISLLFPPVKGTISSEFDLEAKHFAVDIVTVANTPVKAVADGTVIFSEWTAETGFVIILEHRNNLISAYKHNASLTKEQGQLVKAGEVIATTGNTGELSTGPHLHFELWSDGYPINPVNFIDFQ